MIFHSCFCISAGLVDTASQKRNRLHQQQNFPSDIFLCFGHVVLLWSCLRAARLAQASGSFLEGQASLLFLAAEPLPAFCLCCAHSGFTLPVVSTDMIERLPSHPQELEITCSVAFDRNLGFEMVMTKLNIIT